MRIAAQSISQGSAPVNLVPGRADEGGIWVYGLCEEHNRAASVYDGAYKTLADIARPAAPLTAALLLPNWRWKPPSTTVRPGAIARSMLMGAFGFNPRLHVTHPQLAKALLNHDACELPLDLELRLTLTIGKRARVTGPVTGMYVMTEVGNLTQSVSVSVFFPPLAWDLAYTGENVHMFAIEGRPDVRHWLEFDPAVEVPLSTICPPLPTATLPEAHPRWGAHWAWLFSDEICPIVESEDVYAAT